MTGIDTTLIAKYTTGSGGIIAVINDYLVPTLVTVALIVFLFGIAKAYIISSASEQERAKGHQLILWGIIGFVVILSVWGIVEIITTLFGLKTGGVSPEPPTIKTSQPTAQDQTM